MNLEALYFDVAAGKTGAKNLTSINKRGSNRDIDTTTDPETIWPGAGVISYPTTARIHDVVSTNANDADGGSGIQQLTIEGLDINWDPITEVVLMNGVTPVPTTKAFLRINEVFVSLGTGSGTITATAQTDATISAQFFGVQGKMLGLYYSVPRNHKAFLVQYYVNFDAPATVSDSYVEWTLIDVNNNVSDPTSHYIAIEKQHAYRSTPFFSPRPFIAIGAKHDIRLDITNVDDSNTVASGGFDLILEKLN